MFGLFKKNPDKLLKLATRAEKSGDMNEAVEFLRSAYKAIARTRVSYPIETFLRLPLCLQKAGDGRLAWQEFKQLLEGRYHLAPTDKDLILMEQSRVYDKMRLLLQREGQAGAAVGYGIASHFSRALALHKQKRFDELDDFISRDTVEEAVRRLLKKAKMSESHAAIVELLEPTRSNVSRCKPKSLIHKVSRAIGAPSDYEAEDAPSSP